MKPGRWALGHCLKPHGGEEVRYRASLCGSQLSSGVPAFGVAGKYKHSVNKTNTPNCQKVQRPQRSQAMCCSIFGTEIGGLFFFLNLKHFINGPIRVKLMEAAKSCEWNTLGMQLTEGRSCFINHFTLGFSFFKEEERLIETLQSFLVFFIETV